MIRTLHRTLAAGGALGLFALGAGAGALGAQETVREGTIDPGMTRAQVEERLGPPKVVRTSGTATYLFYVNGCARTCGMDDLVVLEQDAVVDAVFRSPAHRYTGQSSSPSAVAPRASGASGAGAPRGVGPIQSDSAMSASGRGGLVIGGPPRAADSATGVAPGARRVGTRRTGRPAQPRSAAAIGTTAPGSTPGSTRPAAGASTTTTTTTTPGAAPASTADEATAARNGQRSTTGPVDARAAVTNPGARLYPAATPVRSPSSAADSSGARVPYQGAQLAPSDSDMRALRRPTPIPGQTTPPARPDSTRP